ncbi:MAG: hypothetical protein II404_02885 [Prevotella sp.]|nr:hypothetical protein [Prevotella sp.]
MMRKATYLLGLLLFSLTSVAHQPMVASASGGRGAAHRTRGHFGPFLYPVLPP